MKVVIAIDSFKGSISSIGAATALEEGIKNVFADAEVVKIPIADGGEGTAEALLYSVGGEEVKMTVTGPLGEPVEASWGHLSDGTAVIEMASASGLPLVPLDKRDPSVTTTYGTGELFKAALDAGCRKFIVCLGGSATNDGGAGLAQALGVSIRDAAGKEVGFGGGALANAAVIDISGLDKRLEECDIRIASDVTNPLLGPTGASAAYGPQKGASPEMVEELEAALTNYAKLLEETLGYDVASQPGAGAAGGLGVAVLGFCKAKMQSGIDLVLEAANADQAMEGADLAITGEGRMDRTSAFGKAPTGVAKVAKAHDVPVFAFCGCFGPGFELLYDYGIDAITPIADGPMTVAESMENAGKLLTGAADRVMRVYKVGLAK